MHYRMLSPFRFFHQQHERQIDPTDIVLVPYDLKRLTYYVMIMSFILLLYTRQLPKLADNYPVLAIMFMAVMVLAGASPSENILHTLMGACHTTALCLTEPPLFHAPLQIRWLSQILRYRLSGEQPPMKNVPVAAKQPMFQQMLVARTTTQCCLAGTSLSSILRLYDWGIQVQRWPVPTILGGTVGWAVGVVVGAVLASWSGGASPRRHED